MRLVHSLCGVLPALWIAIAPAAADLGPTRSPYAAILRDEARLAGLPVDIADAVMAIESGYDATKIGGVGEIGLMQVRPTTAAMLGFRGTPGDLAQPVTNIHYGVAYLAEAWRQADGDLCRALMKYRAGHGETVMSPLSVTYCARARAHLAAVGSAFAGSLASADPPLRAGPARRGRAPPPLRGAAFWAAHEARIRRLDAKIEQRWRRMASR